MCRIAGIISSNHPLENVDLRHMELMSQSMAHGGPDGEGSYTSPDSKIVFAHRRLSVIDLTKNGSQPMVVGDNSITYNGEIYNYQELKKELLKLDFSFKTNTDTEVILAAYSAWGESSFEKLNGMFSFSLYDAGKQIAYLVRDPCGIKPLYYGKHLDKLYFASEVKAFNTLKLFQVEKKWRILFLAFGHIPEPYTTLENVTPLQKGHFVKCNLKTNEIIVERYFAFNCENKIKNYDEAVENIKSSFHNAVNRHLIADTEVGVFVSGGIDSSIIALLANQYSKKVNTISMNFFEKGFDEEIYQNIILNKIRSNHTSTKITEDKFEGHFKAALDSMDQPSIDGINTWFICKTAKEKKIKVVLSGVGADELLGGYPSFDRKKTTQILSSIPGLILKIMSRLPIAKLKRLYYLSFKNDIGLYLFLRGIYTPIEISKILNISISDINKILNGITLDMPEQFKNTYKAKISWLEFNLYLQNQLLKDSDSMSMTHSIELRTPFLDKEFVQTCLNIENSIKFDTPRKKQILIDAFIDLLPKEIYDRPKMGFILPFAKWLRNKLIFEDLLDKNISIYEKHQLTLFLRGELPWSKALSIFNINYFKSTKH